MRLSIGAEHVIYVTPVALVGSVESVLEGKRCADRLRVVDSTHEMGNLCRDGSSNALVERQQARQIEHGGRDARATEVDDAQPLIAGMPHKVPTEIAVAERTTVAINASKSSELGCRPSELEGTHAIPKQGVDVRGHRGRYFAERRGPHPYFPRYRRCRFQTQEKGGDLVVQLIRGAAAQIVE